MEMGNFDMIICLGVVIRGETTHYDVVAGESCRALMDLSLMADSVLINGILTCENEDQVKARISPQYAISGLNYLAELVDMSVIAEES